MTDNFLGRIWPEWQIVRKLGAGSYGVVYEAIRQDHSIESHSAIKIISVPSEEGEVQSLLAEGMTSQSAKNYLKGVVGEFVSEIQLMETFKGVQNIVSVEDYRVVEKTGSIGWIICIRMELLTPFTKVMAGGSLSESEVIRLGVDLCSALELCERQNVIHRDIKPENIFVNQYGNYKLGDFGIARKLEHLSSGLSAKGTWNYMAPEISRQENYDSTVDLYSAGLVLYRLLNHNRLPFIENEAQLSSPGERMNAVRRRMNAEALPVPDQASPAMAAVILKACSFRPEDRFQSASEMKKALLQAAENPSVSPVTSSSGAPGSQMPAYVGAGNAGYGGAAAGNYYGTVNQNSSGNGSFATQTYAQAGGGGYGGGNYGGGHYPGGSWNNGRYGGYSGFSGKKKKKLWPWITGGICIVMVLVLSIGLFFLMKPGNHEESAIQSVIAEAEQLAAQSDYDAAIRKINMGLADHPDSEELQEKSAEYGRRRNEKIRKEAVEEAQKLADQQDYMAAWQKISDALTQTGDSNELNELQKQYEDQYCQQISQQAMALIETSDLEEAKNLVSTAQKHFPSNSVLAAAYEKAAQEQNLQPVWLISEYEPYNSDGTIDSPSVISMAGKEYAHGFVMVARPGDYNGNQVSYNIDGKYASMTFVPGCAEDTNDTFTVSVWGDDELLDSLKFDSGDLPEARTVNLAGVSRLTFSAGSKNYGKIGFTEIQLFPKDGTEESGKKLADNEFFLMKEITPYKTPDYGYRTEPVFEMNDQVYTHGFTQATLPKGKVSQLYFNLDGRFSKLTFDAGFITNDDGDAWIVFKGDGNELARFTLRQDTLPQSFSVDLKNCSQLIIEISGGEYDHIALGNLIVTE